ncbi:hypothetical protein L204_102450 [Cryptococcus depauperatus]|nr:hypothetical protein L204_00802 [Cryptococcus depauperatus CBS 7855]
MSTSSPHQQPSLLCNGSHSQDPLSADPAMSGSVVKKVHLKVLVISGQSHHCSFEPETTVGRMKELLWSSWPKEWSELAQPPSPNYLRVLYSGRILQDDSTLSDNSFSVSSGSSLPTVVHLSVRSFSIKNDDDTKKSSFPSQPFNRSHAQEDDVGRCRCVIM